MQKDKLTFNDLPEVVGELCERISSMENLLTEKLHQQHNEVKKDTHVPMTVDEVYNPQNEMFRLLGTKRSFSQNETFFFSHPYPALFRLISHF